MNGYDTLAHYSISVRGTLSDRLLAAFPDLHPRPERGETVLEGNLPDQAALHGVLAMIEALGLELLEVRRARTTEMESTASDDDRSSGLA